MTNAATGAVVGRIRYSTYGEEHYTSGSTPTNYRYTGQLSKMATVGLYYYGARWFDPALAHFVQADTIVPGTGNPLAWDRYAGMFYNPFVYIDPSGHASTPAKWSEPGECNLFSCLYNVLFTGKWTYRNMLAGIAAVKAVGAKISEEIGGTAFSAFNAVFKERVTLAWVSNYKDEKGVEYTTGAITKSSRRIEIASLTQVGGNRTEDVAFTDARNTIVHELGHAFASLWYRGSDTYDPDGPYGTTHPIPANYLSDVGFAEPPGTSSRTWRQHPCTAANYSYCKNEVIADQFLGWTFGQWANNKVGLWREDYMATNMVEWIRAVTSR